MSVFKRDRDPYQSPAVSTPAAKQTPAPVAEPAPKESVSAYSPAAASAPPAARAASAGPQPSTLPVNREIAAVIDKKSEFKGTLHSQGDVLVEGSFEGEIEAKATVWVEKGAQTQAQLRANDVIVSGAFNGEIDCQHRLHITATASITGQIKTPVLVIEDGATVNCRFSMTRSKR